MLAGTIKCSCKKEFYAETVQNYVSCPYCGENHSTEGFTELEMEVISDGEEVQLDPQESEG